MPNTPKTELELDSFTRAYIEAALWSSTLEPFGECVSCGKDKVLCQFDADGDGPESTLCSDCGGDSSKNTCEPPADQNYSIDDLASETLVTMVEDCKQFQSDNAEWITDAHWLSGPREDYDVTEQAGHDFWLTRCNHGCGFWDGDWNDAADEAMTVSSRKFGEVNLYVGDDGRVYA